MKKNFSFSQPLKVVALFILSAVFTNASAQNGYATFGLGYGFASPTSILGTTSNNSSTENIYGSYGKGMNYSAALGYMFTEHVGAELGFSYLSGAEYELTTYDSLGLLTGHAYGNMLRVIPAMKVSAGKNNPLYAKFGVIFGVGPELKGDLTGSINGISFTEKAKADGGSSTGWMAALGADFKAGENFSVYVELNSISQTYAPEKSTITLTALGQSFTETVTYSDRVGSNSGSTALKTYEPFSSIGINAGVKIDFGGTAARTPAGK